MSIDWYYFELDKDLINKAISGRMRPKNKCWCGSDKQWKNCHLRMSKEEPISNAEFTGIIDDLHEHEICWFHNKNNCSNSIISAHTISKSNQLSTIAENNKVYTAPSFTPHPSDPRFSDGQIFLKSAIKKATTFKGFCSHHDTVLFIDIDNQPIVPTPTQAFLISYRSLCRELSAKLFQFKTALVLMTESCKGLDTEGQVLMYLNMVAYINSITTGFKELYNLKLKFDDALNNQNDINKFEYMTAHFSEKSPVLASGVMTPEVDFTGGTPADLMDQSKDYSPLVFSLLNTTAGSMMIWFYAKDSYENRQFSASLAESYISKNNVFLVGILMTYIFEFFENIALKISWWDKMRPIRKERALNCWRNMGPQDSNRDPICLISNPLLKLWETQLVSLQYHSATA